MITFFAGKEARKNFETSLKDEAGTTALCDSPANARQLQLIDRQRISHELKQTPKKFASVSQQTAQRRRTHAPGFNDKSGE